MGASAFPLSRRRFVGSLHPLFFLAFTAVSWAGPAAACELVFEADDPLREKLGLHAGVYRCGEPLIPARDGLVPVAALRLDLAGDGDADLIVEYRDAGGADRFLMLPVVGSRLGLADELVDVGSVSAARSVLGAMNPVVVPPDPILLVTRLDADGHPELVVALDDGSVAIASLLMALAVVNSTSEAVDFAGSQQIGDLPGPDGFVTLREAILAANNTAGADVIQFNIASPGNDCHDGACWFTPSDGEAGPLPPISVTGGAVTIDGYTQTTNRGDTNALGPELVLDGSGIAANGIGFFIQAATNSAIVDFVIGNFPNEGIWAADADALVVSGCYVGVELTGTTAAPNDGNGIKLVIGTSNAAIGGPGTHGVSPVVPNRNLISGNGGAGVSLTDAGTNGNNIQANRIGTDRTGTSAVPNDIGVSIEGSASSNGVGGTTAGAGNLISGNSNQGVQVYGVGTESNFVQGNQIGTTLNGLAALPNTSGVQVQAGATNTLVGGVTAAARNLISGNGNGIDVYDAGTTGTMIQGNWVGLDAGGAAALANSFNGITLHTGTSASTVGGTGAGAGNVLSGNSSSGVHLDESSGNDILGNRIGTNAAGTAAVGNGTKGVFIVGGSDNDVGDGTAAGRNLVSGNGTGAVILSGTAGNRARGNWIGLDAAGTAAIPNLSFAMVLLQNASTGNWIGGPVSGDGNHIVGGASASAIALLDDSDANLVRGNTLGEGPFGTIPAFANDTGIAIGGSVSGTVVGGGGAAANEISNSTGDGITISSASATGNLLTRNSIHDNGGLGIDLGPDGVTPNDAGDGDAGANGLQNFPVLASATNVCNSGVTTIVGAVDTPSPDTGLVELFASPSGDPSGNGEGFAFVAQTTPAFNGSFNTVVPTQSPGSFISSTFSSASGSTSEFSNVVTVVATPFAPGALEAEVVAGPQVALAWTDNASDETGFRIERRAAGGAFALLANVAANQTSHTDPGPFAPGTVYYYRVRAENGGCQSPWTNIASALVPGATTAFCKKTATHHENAQNPYVATAAAGQFGITWREVDDDAASIRYARLDAGGAVVAGPVTLRSSSEQIAGQIQAWSGSRWGMVWYERLGDRWGLFLSTFDLAGNLLSGPIAVSEPAARPVINQMLRPGLAWDGQGWGVVWPDLRSGTADIRYTHISGDGVTKEIADLAVSDGGVSAFGPRMAWNGSHHAIIWHDARSSTNQIYLRRCERNGTPVGASVAVTTAAVIAAGFADLAWDGAGELGLAWIDNRDTSQGSTYFRRLSTAGATLSAETRISDDPAVVENFNAQLSLRRTLTRWVVAVEDGRTGDLSGVEIRLAFADPATGAKLGADVLVSSPVDVFASDHPALAWDGSRMLATWHDGASGADSLEVHAQSLDETGNPSPHPRRVLTSGHAPAGRALLPVIEYLGTGHAVAWLDERDFGGGSTVFLRLFDGSGNPTSAEIEVPDAANPNAFATLAMAWSGEVLAIVWRDGATSIPTLAFFNSAGTKLRPDVSVPQTSPNQPVDIHWSGERFLVAWEKSGGADAQELYTAAYLADGTLAGGPNRISNATGRSQQPSLAGAGSLAVVWRDTRDGNGEIYAAALDPLGARVGPDIRLTNELSEQARPSAAWNGTHFGLAWADSRSGRSEIRFRRLLPDGNPTGGEIQLSADGGSRPELETDSFAWVVAYLGAVGDRGGAILARVDSSGTEIGSERLALFQGSGFILGGAASVAWDGARYTLAMPNSVYLSGEVSIKTSACLLDTTPPSCPTALAAAVAGRDVTLTWAPGTDSDFAVEWQPVSRDGARLAALLPAANSYVDRAREPGSYMYSVGTLNQGYLDAASCPAIPVDVPLFADGFESGNTGAWSATVP